MQMTGFRQAMELTLERIQPLESYEAALTESLDMILAEDVGARVNVPSVDAALKDGYAVLSSDIVTACISRPVTLQITGSVGAGVDHGHEVVSGRAVRILTGGRLPVGADAVVAEERASVMENMVSIDAPVQKGFNVLTRGSDMAAGDLVLTKGRRLTPGRLGLAAAAGVSRVSVFRSPRVWLAATGDEVVMPGQRLLPGQLYASNVTVLDAWCRRYGMATTLAVIGDDRNALRESIRGAIYAHDAVITSGGAWKGERDFMASVLGDLGWDKVYHRVRLGPGKAVGFGMLQGKPVFILPGGPPSNLVAFLKLALPGLMKLAGCSDHKLPTLDVKIGEALEGQKDWTQAIFGYLNHADGEIVFHPHRGSNRLKDLCNAQALLLIPEGISRMEEGETAIVSLLE